MNWIQLALSMQELWDKLKELWDKLPKPHWPEAPDWTVVVAGISIVIGVLLVLIGVFYLFGFVVSHMVDASQKRAAKKAEKKKTKSTEIKADESAPVIKAPVPVAPKAEMNVQQGINEEIVAAISAAVYSIEGSDSKIVSIRRKNPVTGRNPWAQAAVADNTKPF